MASAGVATDARAATVSVSPEPLDFRMLVTVTAAQSEANDIVVDWEDAYPAASVTVADAGAELIAGTGCGSVAVAVSAAPQC